MATEDLDANDRLVTALSTEVARLTNTDIIWVGRRVQTDNAQHPSAHHFFFRRDSTGDTVQLTALCYCQ